MIGKVRTFNTGATRDSDENKFDYEGFLSPLVLERFAEYMYKNRVQPDGTLRDSDNWQKGIPIEQYMKSKFRHFMTTWKWHRKGIHNNGRMLDSLCAELFNTMGIMFEILKKENE